MTSTLIFDAYDAYLAIVTVAAGDTIAVKDGPQPGFAADEQQVIVGCSSPEDDRLFSFLNGAQDFEAIGGFAGSEVFTIPSCLLLTSGGGSFATYRSTAKTFFDALADGLYAAPRGSGDGMLNGAIAPTGWCLFSVLSGSPIANQSGTGLFIPFNLSCEVHFTS